MALTARSLALAAGVMLGAADAFVTTPPAQTTPRPANDRSLRSLYRAVPSTSFAGMQSGRSTCLPTLRMSSVTTFAAADELHAAGKIQEAIDALGQMDGSESYVRRARWTVDLAEDEANKEARLAVLKRAEADALKAVEMDEKNFAAWKATAIVKGKMQKCVGTNEKARACR